MASTVKNGIACLRKGNRQRCNSSSLEEGDWVCDLERSLSHASFPRFVIAAAEGFVLRGGSRVKMSRIRNADWEDDESLAEYLKKYVLANLRRSEVLDFVERDYPQYAWSLGRLSRRMNHFGIKYVD